MPFRDRSSIALQFHIAFRFRASLRDFRASFTLLDFKGTAFMGSYFALVYLALKNLATSLVNILVFFTEYHPVECMRATRTDGLHIFGA